MTRADLVFASSVINTVIMRTNETAGHRRACRHSLGVVACAVLAVACGSSSKPHVAGATGTTAASTTTTAAPAGIADAAALHTAIVAAGFPCDPYKPATGADELGPKTTSAGTCLHAGDTVALDVYADAATRQRAEDAARSAGCQLGKSFGITSFAWVADAKWTASGQNVDTAKALHAAIGGQYHAVNC